ncbi:hypothetical protein ACR77J_09440 [Tissierella praeacuta]|uniref:hypothetical protein n=1 Tax=Tissierella praeacuta TaxID=43131 RepID=UPI003DA46FA9
MERKSLDTTEILSIDFNKYEVLMLDKVFVSLKNAKVAVVEDMMNIILEVFVDNSCIVRSFYNKGNKLRIEELDDNYLVISKMEV